MFRQKNPGPASFFVFEELEEIPGFVHAFTSRQTDAPKQEPVSSDEVPLEKRLLLESLGLQPNQLFFLHQVHSNRVVTVNAPTLKSSGPTSLGFADGVIALLPGPVSGHSNGRLSSNSCSIGREKASLCPAHGLARDPGSNHSRRGLPVPRGHPGFPPTAHRRHGTLYSKMLLRSGTGGQGTICPVRTRSGSVLLWPTTRFGRGQ